MPEKKKAHENIFNPEAMDDPIGDLQKKIEELEKRVRAYSDVDCTIMANLKKRIEAIEETLNILIDESKSYDLERIGNLESVLKELQDRIKHHADMIYQLNRRCLNEGSK